MSKFVNWIDSFETAPVVRDPDDGTPPDPPPVPDGVKISALEARVAALEHAMESASPHGPCRCCGEKEATKFVGCIPVCPDCGRAPIVEFRPDD